MEWDKSGWNEFHKSWNPPHGEVLLNDLDAPTGIDAKFVSCWKPRWYQTLWYGLRHWLRTKTWPARIWYIPEGIGNKKRFLEIYAEVSKNPERYLRY